MSMQVDKDGHVIAPIEVETSDDAIEERLHKVRAQTKAMMAAWRCGDRIAVWSLFCNFAKTSTELWQLLVEQHREGTQ